MAFIVARNHNKQRYYLSDCEFFIWKRKREWSTKRSDAVTLFLSPAQVDRFAKEKLADLRGQVEICAIRVNASPTYHV